MRTVLVDAYGFEVAAGPAQGLMHRAETFVATDPAGQPVLVVKLIELPGCEPSLERMPGRLAVAVDGRTIEETVRAEAAALGSARLAALRGHGWSNDEAHAGLDAWLAGGAGITSIRVRRILAEAGLLG